jgi:sugar-specific transcriptional regulator TrmB
MIEVIKKIEALGFTNYESRVFCVLFEGTLMSASEIATKAGIPRPSVYEILKSFVSKGICNEISTSSVTKFQIIDPDVIEDKLEKEIHDNYKFRITQLKESFTNLKPLFRATGEKKTKVDVELIKGFNKHRVSKFMELWRNSDSELLLMNKLEGYVDTEVDRFTESFLRNGGVIKTIYEASTDFKIKVNNRWEIINSENLGQFISKIKSGKGYTRFTDKVNQSMAIFDRKVVYISLMDPEIDKYNRSDIIVKNKNYAEAMADYFEVCWERSLEAEKYFKDKIK